MWHREFIMFQKRVIIYWNHWAILTEFKWCLYISRLIPDVVIRRPQSQARSATEGSFHAEDQSLSKTPIKHSGNITKSQLQIIKKEKKIRWLQGSRGMARRGEKMIGVLWTRNLMAKAIKHLWLYTSDPYLNMETTVAF